MKAIVLGSGAQVLPQVNARGELDFGEINKSKEPEDRRTRSSLAIQLPGREEYLIIDCTPDYWYQVARAGVEHNVKAILLTSSLYSHSQGVRQRYLPIMTFATRQTWQGLTGAKIPPQHRKTIDRTLISLHGLDIFIFDVWNGQESYNSGDSVRTLGLRIVEKKTGATLVYISNAKNIPPRSLPLLQGADLVILDGITYEKTYNDHRTIISWCKEAEDRLKPKNLWFTSIGCDTMPHDRLEKAVKLRYPKVGICYDSLEFDFDKKHFEIK